MLYDEKNITNTIKYCHTGIVFIGTVFQLIPLSERGLKKNKVHLNISFCRTE